MNRNRNRTGYVAGGMLLGGILVLVGMALGSSRASALAPQNPKFYPKQDPAFQMRGSQGGHGPTVYTPGTQRAESIYWLQSMDGRLANLESLLRDNLTK